MFDHVGDAQATMNVRGEARKDAYNESKSYEDDCTD